MLASDYFKTLKTSASPVTPSGNTNGHWQFPEPLDSKRAVGFVYMIVEKSTRRMYIGKKNFKSYGKLNKGRQTDWKTYVSSSAELSHLIKEIGKDAFEFHVLEQYNSLSAVAWGETWSQVTAMIPERPTEFFSGRVEPITFKLVGRITDRHKERLFKLLNENSNPK